MATPDTSTSRPCLRASHTFISPNDPRLLASADPYAATTIDATGATILSDRALERITSIDGRELLLCLAASGRSDLADRIVNCGTQGEAWKECAKHHVGLAHRFNCGCILCARNCHKSVVQLAKWLAKRDPTQMFGVDHVGVEFVLPTPAGSDPLAAWHSTMGLVGKLLDSLTPQVTPRPSAIFRWYLDISGDSSRVRVAMPASDLNLRYPELSERWKRIAGPTAWCETHRATAGSEVTHLFLWVFNSLEQLQLLPPAARVTLYLRMRNSMRRLTRTRGTRYRQLKGDALDEHHAKLEHDTSTCPTCQDSMRLIPREKRHAEAVEAIADRYDRVSWTAGRITERDWLRNQRSPRSTRSNSYKYTSHSSNFGGRWSESPSPPRYGPS